MVLFVYTKESDRLNEIIANLGGGDRSNGKADLPKVNIK